jgi:hypothetical protein
MKHAFLLIVSLILANAAHAETSLHDRLTGDW